jgi:hypothetical protein
MVFVNDVDSAVLDVVLEEDDVKFGSVVKDEPDVGLDGGYEEGEELEVDVVDVVDAVDDSEVVVAKTKLVDTIESG